MTGGPVLLLVPLVGCPGSMDIVIMVTLSQCIIFGSHIPQGAPFSDSMSGDLRNKRRNNPAEEFGEEEQEKNTFILIGMETPVRIECIIANQLLCMETATDMLDGE
ncbi:hypothetical protein TRIUR3_30033 [Triticum urartu]|uniref:Uncharacterized protein n=1 Tax=Triticum urartu TaxID=4572 RepID=M7ZW04_TRIUA|nr:hypothetical protein TRIUR3_30033 [Triticum urartu]